MFIFYLTPCFLIPSNIEVGSKAKLLCFLFTFLTDEANQSLEESGTPSHEIMVIVLHREFTAGSIGITLAGGADYESKDITVRILCVTVIYCRTLVRNFIPGGTI